MIIKISYLSYELSLLFIIFAFISVKLHPENENSYVSTITFKVKNQKVRSHCRLLGSIHTQFTVITTLTRKAGGSHLIYLFIAKSQSHTSCVLKPGVQYELYFFRKLL